MFRSFWCVDVKNNFFKKNITLIYFRVKNTLKSNHNHTFKHALHDLFLWNGSCEMVRQDLLSHENLVEKVHSLSQDVVTM
jgi:hypothetical protein